VAKRPDDGDGDGDGGGRALSESKEALLGPTVAPLSKRGQRQPGAGVSEKTLRASACRRVRATRGGPIGETPLTVHETGALESGVTHGICWINQ